VPPPPSIAYARFLRVLRSERCRDLSGFERDALLAAADARLFDDDDLEARVADADVALLLAEETERLETAAGTRLTELLAGVQPHVRLAA
jgi:hypothetical protein